MWLVRIGVGSNPTQDIFFSTFLLSSFEEVDIKHAVLCSGKLVVVSVVVRIGVGSNPTQDIFFSKFLLSSFEEVKMAAWCSGKLVVVSVVGSYRCRFESDPRHFF